MSATAKDFSPTYVSEIIKEIDGDLNDCTLCAAISLADAWTLGEFLTRSDGGKRNVISLRERRVAILGPAKEAGGLTLADADFFLRSIDPRLPPLPRYPGHGGNQRFTFDEFWDLLSDGHAAVLLGVPANVKNENSPLRTKQRNDAYKHAVFVFRAKGDKAILYDALTRHGPDWNGEPVARKDLKEFSTSFGTPTAIGCAVIEIGSQTEAARAKRAGEVSIKLLKSTNKNLVNQRDELQKDLDLTQADLDAAHARIVILESATQPDLTEVKRAARQSFKDEVMAIPA